MSKSTIDNHSSNKNQNLSDLLDGYGDVSQNLNQLLSDKQQQQTWKRYHMVSAVLKKENSAHSSEAFLQSVSELIADEPSIIARPQVKNNAISTNDTAGDIQHVAKTTNVASIFWKKASGLAVAASVAYAMIFSVDLMEFSTQAPLNSQFGQTQASNSPMDETQVSSSLTAQASAQGMTEVDSKNNLNLFASLSESDAAEQERLDRIQAMINNLNKTNANFNEQYVGGETVVSVKLKKVEELEKQVRDMKKPSEIKSREK
ncbi:sigma-E factor negative regulatory protein [Aliikangiella maris]|uniref:RseA family anti-sigma factor n=2 Tax=Aliikangiella maris TaxID=3162458 RepID=A0ABV3MJF7_9GAMM